MLFEKQSKTTAIEKRKSTLPATLDFGVDPETYNSGISERDVKIPLMLLVHSQSKFPEWKQMDKADVPSAGDFYNPVTQEKFEAGFKALVVHAFTQAYTQKPDPDKENRKIINRFSSDGKTWNDNGDEIQDAEYDWKDAKGDERDPEEIAYKRFQYVIIPEGTVDPCIIRFQKTSAKNARKMNYVLFRLIPTWKYWTEFASTEEQNQSGDEYLVMTGQVQRNMPLQDQALATMALDIHNSYKDAVIEVVESDKDEADETENPDYSDDDNKSDADSK